jgi:uncharacterized membrane protein (DUF2068 family)
VTANRGEHRDQRSSRAGFLGFKVIGTFKLISGIAALALGIWSLYFLDQDPAHGLARIISQLGLDPQNRVIHWVLSAVTGVDRKHLRAIEAGTFFYALLHIIEGTGLILERDWAGYLVVIATSSLIPFEIHEIAKKMDLLRISILVANVGIAIYLIVTLRIEHARRSKRPA